MRPQIVLVISLNLLSPAVKFNIVIATAIIDIMIKPWSQVYVSSQSGHASYCTECNSYD